MHHIHHTNALIISSRPHGEASKVFTLFTRELGLIKAVAQSVRLSRSRLRYTLQDFSYAKVDLVRGRDTWRITSATAVTSFSHIRSSFRGARIIGNVSKLLDRLVQGEEVVSEIIFDDILSAYSILDVPNSEDRLYEVTELCLVLRVLKHLGYISDSESVGQYTNDAFTFSDVDYSRFDKKTIIFEINRALRESHL